MSDSSEECGFDGDMLSEFLDISSLSDAERPKREWELPRPLLLEDDAPVWSMLPYFSRLKVLTHHIRYGFAVA